MKFDYDPNAIRASVVHRVRLTLGCWKYRAIEEVEVRGNVMGFAVLKAAVWALYDKLPEVDSVPRLTLTSGKYDVLHCDDDEDRGEDWLEDYVLSASIVEIKSCAESVRTPQANDSEK